MPKSSAGGVGGGGVVGGGVGGGGVEGHIWPPVVFQHREIHPSEAFKGPRGNTGKPFSGAR